MGRRGDAALIIAIGVSVLLFAAVSTQQYFLRLAEKSRIEAINNFETFNFNELLAWHAYTKKTLNAALPNGTTPVSFPIDSSLDLSTVASSSFDPGAPAGTDFNVKATLPLDSGRTFFNRIKSDTLRFALEDNSICGRSNVLGSKTEFRVCFKAGAPDACGIVAECGGVEICPKSLETATPIEISTLAQFKAMQPRKRYLLKNDINYGGSGEALPAFDGLWLDGGGYRVRNFTLSSGATDNQPYGVFRSVQAAIVKNIGFDTVNISNTARNSPTAVIGDFIGSGCIDTVTLNNVTISNVYSTAALQTGPAGGLLGRGIPQVSTTFPPEDGKRMVVQNINATGLNVTGRRYTGGLVGYTLTRNNTFEFRNVSVTGTVRGMNNTGGVFGAVTSTLSYASSEYLMDNVRLRTGSLVDAATISGTLNTFTGGIIGLLDDTKATMTNLNSEGTITGFTYLGGIIGHSTGTPNIDGCSSSGTISGIRNGSDNYDRYLVGGIVGSGNAFIKNCQSSAIVVGENRLGGILGSGGGSIERSRFTGEVRALANGGGTGNWAGAGLPTYGMLGGLVGEARGGGLTVDRSFSTGNVLGIAGATNVGGGVGQARMAITVSNSYARGRARGTDDVGGFLGINCNNAFAASCVAVTLTNVYSDGVVEAIGTPLVPPAVFGGLVGRTYGNVTVVSSYWDTVKSTRSSSAGGTGLNSGQMQNSSNFVGWNFSTIWLPPSGGNPPTLRP